MLAAEVLLLLYCRLAPSFLDFSEFFPVCLKTHNTCCDLISWFASLSCCPRPFFSNKSLQLTSGQIQNAGRTRPQASSAVFKWKSESSLHPLQSLHLQVHPRSRCPVPGEKVWSHLPRRGREGGGGSQRHRGRKCEARWRDSARRWDPVCVEREELGLIIICLHHQIGCNSSQK